MDEKRQIKIKNILQHATYRSFVLREFNGKEVAVRMQTVSRM